jgi:hypothetical protein
MATFQTPTKRRLAYYVEDSYGVAPSPNDSTTTLPAENIQETKDINVTVSEDIRNDRRISQVYKGSRAGGLTFDFVYRTGVFDDLLISVARNAIVSSDLAVGGSTERSLGFEVQEADINRFTLYTGAVVSQMTLTMDNESGTLRGSVTLVSQPSALRGATQIDATPTEWSPANGVHNQFGSNGVNLVSTNLSTFAAATNISGWSVTIDNEIVAVRTSDSAVPVEYAVGRCNVTGEVSFLYDTQTQLTWWDADTPIGLKFQTSAENDDDDTFGILLAEVQWTGGGSPEGDGAMVNTMPFQAINRELSDYVTLSLDNPTQFAAD